VKQLMDLAPRSLLLTTALTLVVTPRVSHAQARVDCSRRISPSVGFSVGRSLTPSMEMAQGVVAGGPRGSAQVRGGLYLTGRVDVPIAGPWRGRVEVSGARPVTAGIEYRSPAAVHPVVGTCALAANISAGWSHRF